MLQDVSSRRLQLAHAGPPFTPLKARSCKGSAAVGSRRRQREASCKLQPSEYVHAVSESQATSTTSNEVLEGIAEASQQQPAGGVAALVNPNTLALIGAAALLGYGTKRLFDKGSRAYDSNVGDEYDAWTEEGVLEYYWGEHIHLGYYTDEEREGGLVKCYQKSDFKQAKYRFSEKMLEWSGAVNPTSILDVGCGIGGTSRFLAAQFPNAAVKGITLSPNQVQRGTELAQERGLGNCSFQVMDALNMQFEDDSFDLVWACESGEHMPDKKKYIEEMTRVLKPGGTLVIACWCQREETPDNPLTQQEKKELQFLYDEWAHPYFISIQEFARIMEGTGALQSVVTDDWNTQTLPSWRHNWWVGIFDPWIVASKPKIWYKTIRDGVTLERMHRAFDKGLMQYGMMKAVKKEQGKQQQQSVAVGAGTTAW